MLKHRVGFAARLGARSHQRARAAGASLRAGNERSGLAQAEQLFQIVFFVEDPGGGA